MTTTSYDQPGGLERVRYFPRQLLNANDLLLEQEYHRRKLRRHNRYLHGWGVVVGGEVRPGTVAGPPWQIVVCPGYLLTPQGDEVMIAEDVEFDLADCVLRSRDPCATARPCPPVSRRAIENRTLYLAVRYLQCEAHAVRVPGTGCACDEVECEYARFRDGYELCALSTLPKTHQAAAPDCEELCQGTILPFAARPPDDPWVVLATITLPELTTERLTVGNIDNLTHRRLLYPTRAVQALAWCGCQESRV